MCFIELVDFNENMLKDKAKTAAPKTRRSRRKKSDDVAATAQAQTEQSAKEETKEEA